MTSKNRESVGSLFTFMEVNFVELTETKYKNQISIILFRRA